MQRFSPEMMWRRFLSPKRHLSPTDLRRLARVDQRHHIALAAVAAEDPARLLAVARCVRLKPFAARLHDGGVRAGVRELTLDPAA